MTNIDPATRGAPPQVSVIVPVRDRRCLLADCLDALASQTHRDFEVIVVDDGSADGSAEVALDPRRDIRVRVVRGVGDGAVSARCLGVASSAAPILAFSDSDCRPSPRWLALGVAALTAGADLAHGPTVSARRAHPLERTTESATEGLYPTCNLFLRREAYDRAGGFDVGAHVRFGFPPDSRSQRGGFGEDTLLAWQVQRQGRATFVEDAIVVHHVFPPDVGDAVRRAWMGIAFPQLVREVPELRSRLLSNRVFLGGPTRLPLYAAAAGLVLRRPRLAGVAIGAWVATHGVRVARADLDGGPGVARTLAAALTVDAVTAAALVVGGARARRLVL